MRAISQRSIRHGADEPILPLPGSRIHLLNCNHTGSREIEENIATHSVPKVVQTDNGQPFNSHEFKQLANETGFIHKPVMPYHPKAQGQVENFNKLINKIAAIAKQDHINFHEATYDMLQAYRSTPHPATNSTPYELLMNRRVRTKINHFPIETSSKDDAVTCNDQQYKEKAKRNHDKRHQSKEYKLKTGDAVIVKREKKKKGETPYKQYIYVITKIKGTMVTAKRMKDGKTKCRDISRFKRLKMYKYPEEEQQQNQETLVPPAPEKHINSDQQERLNGDTESEPPREPPQEPQRSK